MVYVILITDVLLKCNKMSSVVFLLKSVCLLAVEKGAGQSFSYPGGGPAAIIEIFTYRTEAISK